jgi:hypothetical protein
MHICNLSLDYHLGEETTIASRPKIGTQTKTTIDFDKNIKSNQIP